MRIRSLGALLERWGATRRTWCSWPAPATSTTWSCVRECWGASSTAPSRTQRWAPVELYARLAGPRSCAPVWLRVAGRLWGGRT
eukprot:4958658-Heterocapsa_arctica.AAC.1